MKDEEKAKPKDDLWFYLHPFAFCLLPYFLPSSFHQYRVTINAMPIHFLTDHDAIPVITLKSEQTGR